MFESNMKISDFAYPFQMISATFIIRKSEYKPEVLGILKTFSWQLWIAIFSILIAISVIHYVNFKKKIYPLNKVLLHNFEVFMRQNSILKSSSMAENLRVFSWVVREIFISLAYDSVFLSFLSFPPVNPLKDISQLSKAVLIGDYHCVIHSQSAFNDVFEAAKQENLKVIGADIKNNNIDFANLVYPFL